MLTNNLLVSILSSDICIIILNLNASSYFLELLMMAIIGVWAILTIFFFLEVVYIYISMILLLRI